MSIASFLKSLFSFPSNSFESVVLLKGVASQICELARAHYPREVVYFLSGKILNYTLFIDGLLYQHYSSDSRHGIVYQNLPILSSMVGSFHSHPGFSCNPSKADLSFFRKYGFVHFIIRRPYDSSSFCAYDSYGHPIPFQFS